MLSLTRPDLVRQQCLIAGTWCGAATAAVIDPATGAQIAAVPRFGATEATDAVEAAAAAFEDWAGRLAKDRSRILRRWFDLMTAHRQDLARILTAE